MSDDPKPPSEADRELEREIRRGRRFSTAEAIGRLMGSGGMKGGSPVSRLHQAQAETERLIRQHISDPVGVLTVVLVREVGESRALLDNLDQPQAALCGWLRQLLATEALFSEFVRMTDMEWGRVQQERPYFEIDGRPPHPHDPYTLASVGSTLARLLASLEPRQD